MVEEDREKGSRVSHFDNTLGLLAFFVFSELLSLASFGRQTHVSRGTNLGVFLL
jgi:hypothetical protein